MKQIYKYDDRLIMFAGESVFFTRTLNRTYEEDYYKGQLIRSSGSCALNYGEAQGTTTDRDFIFKGGIVMKELRESEKNLKVLTYIKAGDEEKRTWLLNESAELIKIMSTMIMNKKK